MANTTNRVRLAGAGFTFFTYAGQTIAFCSEVQNSSPKPVAQPSFIQPMDEPYAIDILIPPAASPGTITLRLFELFGAGGHASKAWDRLGANLHGNSNTPFGPVTTNGAGNESSLLQGLAGAGPFAGAVDIVDILIRQARMDPTQMQITKVVRPLAAGIANTAPYTEEYVGATIVDVVDGETIMVGTKELVKEVTFAYRYAQRNGQSSQAFAVRAGGTPSIAPTLG